MTEAEGRAAIVAGALELDRLGLNHGSAGNLSLRLGDGALVTPSGVPARELAPGQIARMRLDDESGAYEGRCRLRANGDSISTSIAPGPT